MSITLVQLRERSRQRADLQNNDFIEDTELNAYINSSNAELHELLVGAYGTDYKLESHTFTSTVGEDEYDLPADFFELRGIDMYVGGEWHNVHRFNFNERNRSDVAEIKYRLHGDKIKFSPIPDTGTQFRLWYTPTATPLTNDSDTLDDVNNWGEYIIIDAAIKMRIKEESDISALVMQKQSITARIQNIAANRDAAEPETIEDVYAGNSDYWFYR
jgi:hypothetical protein